MSTDDQKETLMADMETQQQQMPLPGDTLRQAREQLGYSQQHVASRLRLKLCVIKSIEDNQFDDALSATFTRGYVRSYAKFVGVAADEVLAQLDAMGQRAVDAQAMHSFSQRTKKEASDNRVMKLTWLVILVVVALSVAFWWQQKTLTSDANFVDQPESAALMNNTEVAEEMQVIEKATAPIQAASVKGDDSVADNAETSSGPKTIAAELVEPQAITPEMPVVPEPEPIVIDGNKLDIAFVGDCWVEIKDADNNRLLSGVYGKGKQFTLEGKAPFRIKLGAPGQAILTYKGEKVDLSRYPNGKVAKLTLPLE